MRPASRRCSTTFADPRIVAVGTLTNESQTPGKIDYSCDYGSSTSLGRKKKNQNRVVFLFPK